MADYLMWSKEEERAYRQELEKHLYEAAAPLDEQEVLLRALV
jgi:hypothetical protein